MDLENEFGVKLDVTYSKGREKPVLAFGFDLNKWSEPKVQVAYTSDGKRIYDKIDLVEFKTNYRPVTITFVARDVTIRNCG